MSGLFVPFKSEFAAVNLLNKPSVLNKPIQKKNYIKNENKFLK
jgi:hypothetical protein